MNPLTLIIMVAVLLICLANSTKYLLNHLGSYTIALTVYFPISNAILVLWRHTCTMAPYLNYFAILVLWHHTCTMALYLYYGAIFVLWRHTFTMAPYLYYDAIPVIWRHTCTRAPRSREYDFWLHQLKYKLIRKPFISFFVLIM